MKQILAAFIIAVAVPIFAVAQNAANKTDKDEQMFRRLERVMFSYFEVKPNLDALERLYAEDFFSINADGKTADKQQTLEALRGGYLPIDKITTDDFRLRRYGKVVVISGHSTYFKDGQKIGEVNHTQIWIKRKGQWQLSGWQGTPFSRI